MALTKATYSMISGAPVNVFDYGAYGDGKHDDTAAIQAAINAAGLILTTQNPPATNMNNGVYPAPVVFLPAGTYRLTSSLTLYTGMTLQGQNDIAYSVECTRLIMDTATTAAVATGTETGGVINQNTNIINCSNVYTPTGTTLQANINLTIVDIGFWIVNPGGSIANRTGSAWDYGTYTGSAIAFASSVIDTRIKRCNFYSIPNAAIWLNQSSTSGISNLIVHECEFDTPNTAIKFNSGNIALTCTDNEFYTQSYSIVANGSIGGIDVYNNVFQLDRPILSVSSATLNYLNFVANDIASGAGSGSELVVENVKQINISNNLFGVTANNTIRLTGAVGGVISSNTIIDSGFNTTATDPTTDAGAIVLNGCKNVVVSSNSITTPDSASYNGFGILTLGTSACTIVGNIISNSYANTSYRSQSRALNVQSTDTIIGNTLTKTTSGGPDDYRIIASPNGVYTTQQQFTISTSTTTNVSLTGLSNGTISLNVCPLSSSAVFNFTITIGYNNFAGTYNILNVSKNGVVGSGNGPFTISSGPNTLTFSISSSALVLSTSIATDSILVSYTIFGSNK